MNRPTLSGRLPSLLLAVVAALMLTLGARVVGSVNSNVYHTSSCRYVEQIHEHNLRAWPSPAAAERAGRRPCAVCEPGEDAP